MGRELNPDEIALCKQAWSRRSDDPDSDYFRCPWCNDPDLGGPKTEGGEDPVGCREDECGYLIATLGDSGEIDGDGDLEEIAGFQDQLEGGHSFDFLDYHPLVVTYTIGGGGVGSSWSLTCWWAENPGDESLTQFITAYRDRLKVEAEEADADDST